MRWWQSRKRHADLERELQSDLDLEEEEQHGRLTEESRKGATPSEIADMHLDVNFGMIFSITRFWPFGVRTTSPATPFDRISFVLVSRDTATVTEASVLFLASFASVSFESLCPSA